MEDNPIPVICDLCRAAGLAGEDPFADLADLLSFTPVPRRPHANGWTPEFQRAFIAALAATGSAPRAARAIGKHAFGAEQLRKARGGSSFAAAWDAALDLARERELAGLREGLAELAAENDDNRLARRSAILPAAEQQLLLPPSPLEGEDTAFRSSGGRAAALYGEGSRPIHPDCDYDPDCHTDDYPEYWEAKMRIRARLTNARRLLLFLIHNDEAKRAAWEELVGPTDWGKAERLEAQENEPFNDACPEAGRGNPFNDDPDRPESGMPNMTQPDMLLTAEAGLLAEIAGGEDALAELSQMVESESTEAKAKAESQCVEKEILSVGQPPVDDSHSRGRAT